MCIICVELDKNKLTPWEAARNRREYLDILDEEHLNVLNEKINDKLKEFLNNLSEENKNERQIKRNDSESA